MLIRLKWITFRLGLLLQFLNRPNSSSLTWKSKLTILRKKLYCTFLYLTDKWQYCVNLWNFQHLKTLFVKLFFNKPFYKFYPYKKYKGKTIKKTNDLKRQVFAYIISEGQKLDIKPQKLKKTFYCLSPLHVVVIELFKYFLWARFLLKMNAFLSFYKKADFILAFWFFFLTK